MNNAQVAAPRRAVRSFVRRDGRTTPAQARALARLWPRYGIDPPAAPPLDLDAVFGRRAPRVCEIGFGNGEHLRLRAAAQPEQDFLGVEVHRPGAGRLLRELEAAGLANVRVACHDAVEVLGEWLAPESLDELILYFPDPWPKKRHHKRRLVQPGFARLAATRLKLDGAWRLATDWADYARQMREALDAEPLLMNLGGADGCCQRPPTRLPTRFEQRGQRLGHAVFDLTYRRRQGP
ncbi:MAG: tRNA (guanosine(46)-N7)-methyltransferase TrmB [Gammaproteobacteria bacterium]|nr:tRNA (guanosine(46)-N7)-methyltransferase TrmB [Gammaproteobacteria bacterium]